MNSKLKEFLRAQLSAFVGGLSDFGIYTICYKLLNFSPAFSNVISGSLGAIVNFVINRYWSFNNTSSPLGKQLGKFVVVVAGSILLKSSGIYLLDDRWHLHPLLSKVIVEIIVSLGFNYTLQRFWVFKK
ncbi:GtrA family protein [Sphingobacterium sp. SRCM116780]|uniref:GtrA family protein n=1 Tax=Sphingobacterium sp. SRCM116780 TaxID=2907623 RepID=UPI001F46794C|nr:GtrA family protein [Sphingobacterium sp. SRCM116780]UIR56389.1 GtrA family protein [Sphingobacterium sp. SRCM116780]